MWKFTEGLYKRDDVVIMFSFTYYAVQNAFRTYPERAGAKLVKIDIPFPLPLENGEDFVVEKLKAGLDAIDTPIR